MGTSLALYLIVLLPLGYADLTEKAQNGGGIAGAVELWCVAKNNADDASLQSALDWTGRGPGGTDCGPIQLGGSCYDPRDIQNTASFAFNTYFLKNGMTDDSCYFQNSAALTSLNPSFGNYKFPASLSMSNGNLSSSTTGVGLGPSEDTSGVDRTRLGWIWPLISTHLIIITIRLIMSN